MRWVLLVAALGACSSSGGGGDEPPPAPRPEAPIDAAAVGVTLPPAPKVPPAPRGLPPTPSPKHNPTTAAKVALGRLLFHDSRLSADGSAACTRCHDPDRGFGDPRPLSTTVAGQLNLRHAPALRNVAYASEYYWDGRVRPLEALIDANWRGQMAADPVEVAGRLADNPTYVAHFRRAFGGAPSAEHIVEALAAYVRTLRSGDAPWDRHEAGDAGAVSAEAIAGAALFRGRARCAQCHPPPLYTDLRYHNIGIGDPARDPGRGRLTRKLSDQGAFRTPTLRGVTRTAPYFHDGSAATLGEAVDHELSGPTGRDAIALSPVERAQLLAFLAALSPAESAHEAPTLP